MTTTNRKKPKVLMELRTCFEGFMGIPQENRLVFRSLNTLDNIEVTGLINHGHRRLAMGLTRGLFGRPVKPHRAFYTLSRLVISLKEDPMVSYIGKIWGYYEKRLDSQLTMIDAIMGKKIKLFNFNGLEYGDFLWQNLFSKTLPGSDYEMIRTARYESMQPGLQALHSISIRRMQSLIKWWPLPELNTSNYDILLTQMPWPTLLAPNTQLVVRYHDAIPVFQPHTVGNARFHSAAHMAALEACRSQKAIFACNSHATRADLLKIYPEFESRSVVIPDTVSPEYYVEKGSDRYVFNSIRGNICPDTEPKFLTSREKERFYERHLMSGPFKFLLMVSTLEPRKNYPKLLAAWDYLRNHGMPDLKLIIVGALAWEYTRIVEGMVSSQEKGALFHLHRIPSGQLRVIYGRAEAVVCPSVAEGFDLSGVETMLCGGAVVASDIPVHREIYTDACEYFNPYSTMDLVKALQRVIGPDSAPRREELVQAGLRHAPTYLSKNITPLWRDFFERVRQGEFKRAKQHSARPAPSAEPLLTETAH